MQRIVFATGPIARAPMRRQPRRDFAQMVSRTVGVAVVVVVASTYNELAGLMHRGDAQVAWLPPAVYVRSNERDGVQLLLETIRHGGSRFRSVLFVKSDAPYEKLEDVSGEAVAWVDQNSCSGYLFPRISLLDKGIDPRTYFRRELVLGSHEAVIRAVEVGTAALGATFMDQNGKSSTPGWTIEVDAAEMRPLMLSEPIPADTICVRGDLDDTLKSDIREALLGLHEVDGGAEVLSGLFGADRFTPGSSDDYEPIRRAIAVSCG